MACPFRFGVPLVGRCKILTLIQIVNVLRPSLSQAYRATILK